MTNFDKYHQHLPELSCPIVAIIGSAQTPAEVSLDPTDLRRLTVEASVYDFSKAAPIQFEIVCFLEVRSCSYQHSPCHQKQPITSLALPQLLDAFILDEIGR